MATALDFMKLSSRCTHRSVDVLMHSMATHQWLEECQRQEVRCLGLECFLFGVRPPRSSILPHQSEILDGDGQRDPHVGDGGLESTPRDAVEMYWLMGRQVVVGKKPCKRPFMSPR